MSCLLAQELQPKLKQARLDVACCDSNCGAYNPAVRNYTYSVKLYREWKLEPFREIEIVASTVRDAQRIAKIAADLIEKYAER